MPTQENSNPELTALLNREVQRCIARIRECEAVEAARPYPSARAANDLARDRAFTALRRALGFLNQLDTPDPEPQVTPAPKSRRGLCLVSYEPTVQRPRAA
jgi:hypothetical protein